MLTVAKQTAELSRNRQKLGQVNTRLRLDGIKSAEGPLMAGIVEGAGQTVKVWGPHAMTGVETPPDRPGLAVIKRVSPAEAEPGDTLTYAIVYRNMGNTPIRSVSIVDSLLPRLEYKRGPRAGLKEPVSRRPSTVSARPSCAGSFPACWLRAPPVMSRSRRSSADSSLNEASAGWWFLRASFMFSRCLDDSITYFNKQRMRRRRRSRPNAYVIDRGSFSTWLDLAS